VSAIGNKYFQDNEPWKLIKRDKGQAHKIISICINMVKNLSILIQPIMPNFSGNIQKQMNVTDLHWSDIGFKLKDHKINEAGIVLKKVEKIDSSEQNKSLLNLKVGKIMDISDHPDAEKLYILTLDLGKEKRQLVAGLREHYSRKEMLGKHIVVATNLKHATLRGVKSEGMLLAAQKGKDVGLLLAQKSTPGESVFSEGIEPGTKEITIEEFSKLSLKAENGKAFCEGKLLKTNSEEIAIDKISSGKIR